MMAGKPRNPDQPTRSVDPDKQYRVKLSKVVRRGEAVPHFLRPVDDHVMKGSVLIEHMDAVASFEEV